MHNFVELSPLSSSAIIAVHRSSPYPWWSTFDWKLKYVIPSWIDSSWLLIRIGTRGFTRVVVWPPWWFSLGCSPLWHWCPPWPVDGVSFVLIWFDLRFSSFFYGDGVRKFHPNNSIEYRTCPTGRESNNQWERARAPQENETIAVFATFSFGYYLVV